MAAPASTPPRATGMSLAALVLGMLSVGAVGALHLLRADLDPLQRVMSEYANGAHGTVMTIAFYAFGLSCVALSVRLRREFVPRGAMACVIALLLIAGVGLLLSGAFEVGRRFVPDSIEETVHSTASIGAFVALLLAMVLFSTVAPADERWRSFRLVSWPLTLGAGAAAVLSPLVTAPSGAGIVQRVLGGSILLWLLLVARRIRSNAFRPTVTS